MYSRESSIYETVIRSVVCTSVKRGQLLEVAKINWRFGNEKSLERYLEELEIGIGSGEAKEIRN